MADFALSVKLWPAWPPAESPVTVSGTVESVEAMVFFVLIFLGGLLGLMLGVGCWFQGWVCEVVMSGRMEAEGNGNGNGK